MPYATRPIVVAACLSVLAGCDQAAAPVEKPPVVRPVKTVVVPAAESSGERTFPARIAAAREADLSFTNAGTLRELPVKEGQRVAEGDVIAELDPRDFTNTLLDRDARYQKAKSEFERGAQLIEKNFISRQDYEALQASLRSARAELETARKLVADAVLRAPFDGLIGRRYVENFQEVQAKQPIVALQDLSQLEVVVDIPESIIVRVRTGGEGADASQRGANAPASVRFESAVDRTFPLTMKEIATQADPQTKTYRVTYRMEVPEDMTVLPGMTATVTVDLSQVLRAASVFRLPVDAVVGDVALEPAVWVVDPQTMQVAPRRVTVGQLLGDHLEVSGGVEEGERVVVAGVSFLREGMKVRLLPDVEQAQQ